MKAKVIFNDKEYDAVLTEIVSSTKYKNTKSPYSLLKEKYDTGKYICYYQDWNEENKWREQFNPNWSVNHKYKLIHKSHAHIAEAVAKDSNIQVQKYVRGSIYECQTVKTFFDTYDEFFKYELNEPKQEYPKWFKSKGYGHIVKFNSKSSGTVVFRGDSSCEVGYTQDFWIPYDEEERWKEIPEPNPLDFIPDMYPVECWNDTYHYSSVIRFWNAFKKEVRDDEDIDQTFSYAYYRQLKESEMTPRIKELWEKLKRITNDCN